jgi:hypothetical protein
MKKTVIGAGIAMIVFGVLFQFQGRGIVGPESSFMYYNKDWIYYGIGIAVSGIWFAGLTHSCLFILDYVQGYSASNFLDLPYLQ